jgi:indole-3-acetate monooxygenase
VLISAGAGTAFAWLDPPVATALLQPDTRAAASLMAGPLGIAAPSGDGYRVTGRWPFVTGCLHSQWHILAVRIPGAAGPHRHLAFLPRRDTTVVDTWNTWGLRGTGSHDVVVDDVDVPAEHIVTPTAEPPRHRFPLGRVPFWTQLAVGHAAFSLGVARRGLDEFTTIAVHKHRGAAEHTVAATGDAQVVLARAEATLRAARTFVLDVCATVDATASAGQTPDLDLRTQMLLAALNAQQAAETAVDSVLPLAGAGVLRDDSALHRCYRDLHAAGQHIFLSADAWKRCAARYLDLPQATHLL